MKGKAKRSLIGIFAGFINGLLGSGGGTIVVPSLQFLDKVETHKAHATAIAVILPLSIVSAAVYLFKGSVPLNAVLWVGAGSIIGSIVGALLLKKLSGNFLRKAFGIIMIISAIRMFMI